MEKEITAEELFYDSKHNDHGLIHYKDAARLAVQFAELHVMKALITASENVVVDIVWLIPEDDRPIDGEYEVFAIKSSILSAYPLHNIK